MSTVKGCLRDLHGALDTAGFPMRSRNKIQGLPTLIFED